MNQVVACAEVQATTWFKLEHSVYPYIGKMFKRAGYTFHRIDTVNQIGFPDCLCIRESDYFLIEVKLLKTNKLTDLLTNLKWQPGQIPFMLNALRNNQKYLLVVAKGDKLLIIGAKTNVWTMLSYSHNIRQL